MSLQRQPVEVRIGKQCSVRACVVVVVVVGGVPVCVLLHWLAIALRSAADGTHPGRKLHVTLFPWLPIKDAAGISNQCFVIFNERTGAHQRAFLYCVFVRVSLGSRLWRGPVGPGGKHCLCVLKPSDQQSLYQ